MRAVSFIVMLILWLLPACSGATPQPRESVSSVGGESEQTKPANSASAAGDISASNDIVPLKPLGEAGELASYYSRHLAIKDGKVYGWTGDGEPKVMLEQTNVVQVGVGDTTSYALLKDGRLLGWSDNPSAAVVFAEGVVSFSAGRTGLFAITQDGRLWRYDAPDKQGAEIAKDVAFSSIGDGTDYYITRKGELFARGLAHRGQYGNGTLESTPEFIQVASDAIQVRGHTGHAILLKSDGEVQGTGGNLYGPLGTHGLGDKATTWGTLFAGASMIATGFSHSAAIKQDGTLWLWGAKEGTSPRQVLADVSAVAAGQDVTLAKTKDDVIWFWRTGETPRKILE